MPRKPQPGKMHPLTDDEAAALKVTFEETRAAIKAARKQFTKLENQLLKLGKTSTIDIMRDVDKSLTDSDSAVASAQDYGINYAID